MTIKLDLDSGEKDLFGGGDYRPGRQSRYRGNQGQFKTARTE
jgi:hypothetical protein